MHRSNYAELIPHDPAVQRSQEREAFLRGIALLERAEAAGAESAEAQAALEHVSKLWCYLLEDLGRPDNDLPAELRKALIELGQRVLHEVGRISRAESVNFVLLREISASMAAGLA